MQNEQVLHMLEEMEVKEKEQQEIARTMILKDEVCYNTLCTCRN